MRALFCAAADVLQTMHVILLHSGMVGTYADPTYHLACLLAAAGKCLLAAWWLIQFSLAYLVLLMTLAGHDLDHGGLTKCADRAALPQTLISIPTLELLFQTAPSSLSRSDFIVTTEDELAVL
jgi:hypothetical protein